MRNNKTIASVVKDGLCIGCGTCAGVCPTSAIKMVKNRSKGIYIAQLDEERCNRCGICFKVCPGHAVDFKQLNSEIFGKQPEDILLGNCLNCYVGHATDFDIRFNSASGGLVTALLIFALEQGIIDGALVTKMSEDNPLEPQPFIARTREEIISAAKSKYCPVPANIALEEILRQDGKFAVVGLPCHIHGIRKAEAINRKLAQKISLHLGIFCGSVQSFHWTDFLFWHEGIRKEDVVKLDYRSGGWPGTGILIHLRDGADKFIPGVGVGAVALFYRPRCHTLCCDHSAELADISFGDAWLPELAGDKVGSSLIICRNRRGEGILQDAASQGKLELDKLSSEKAIQSQKGGLYNKKRVVMISFAFSRLRQKNIPLHNTDLLKPNALAYLRTLELYFGTWVASKRYLWGLLSAYASFRGFVTRMKIRLQKLFD